MSSAVVLELDWIGIGFKEVQDNTMLRYFARVDRNCRFQMEKMNDESLDGQKSYYDSHSLPIDPYPSIYIAYSSRPASSFNW